jgi:hypothetical protein
MKPPVTKLDRFLARMSGREITAGDIASNCGYTQAAAARAARDLITQGKLIAMGGAEGNAGQRPQVASRRRTATPPAKMAAHGAKIGGVR